MAEFNLERIRFRWKGDWVESTQYVKDDIVRYQGKSYVCLLGHESGSGTIYSDLNLAAPDTRWVLMFDGTQWRGDWLYSTLYSRGDIVKFNGYVYQCTVEHSSTNILSQGLINDVEKWTIVASTYNWLNTWTPSTAETSQYYDLGDVIVYGGITYICIQKHVAANSYALGLENDQSSWDIVSRSDNWRTDWAIDTRYTVDDIVRYGGITYRCLEGHTSAASDALGLEADQSKWFIFLEGIEYKTNWTTLTRYKKYDVVKSGGVLWRATEGHTASDSLRVDESKWEVYVPGLEFEAIWEDSIEYNKGDIVVYGGYSYTALTNNIGQVPSVNGILQDTGDWELLVAGYRHLGDWSNSDSYKTGDVIRDQGYLYIAIADSTAIKPQSDSAKWQILVTGRKWKNTWVDNEEYHLGDVVTYAGVAYICVAPHLGTESDNRPDLDIENITDNYWTVLLQGTASNVMTTIGDLRTRDNTETARFGIGTPGNIIKGADNIVWENFEEVSNVFYVAPSGANVSGAGLTVNAPFQTVKYACEYIQSTLGINRINAEIYRYYDNNDNAMTMLAYAALLASLGTLAADAPNLDAALNTVNPRTGEPYGDVSGNGAVNVTDSQRVLLASQLVGSSVLLTEEQVLRYKELIDYLNSRADDFIGENVYPNDVFDPSEANPGMPVVFGTYPNTTIFIKTGIYSEQLPIKVPRNCALVGDELRSTVIQPAAGYELDNMFYVNNGSGIRNMTLQGLAGVLGEPNIYFTRRPTAGAFVSLDPGSGPNDASVWIINKSCYVQNVTTFGTGCIGMKLDGSLHNGGNRSAVANDFTQVLSDGIGYWALNGGRSELVSVFTYFNHIGYLSENGGILRATNGNNSYGTYGSVAEGVNATEVPITAEIDNRTLEAQTKIVHTNGNELVAIGYSHAGQDYTTATGTIAGPGINAAIAYDEFRDNAISQIRLIDPADSSTPGGLNYQYLLNNAQSGDATSITLAASDDTGTPAKYIGMRIVIVSGAGVGQYGYITGYDETTKIAIISKEYNDTNGWENLYPGRPIETTLDATTRYSLEPRVDIDEPEFLITNDTSTTFPADFLIEDGGNKYAAAIQYSNGTYVIVNNSGETAISTNGTTFTASTTLGGSWTGNNFTGSTGTNLFFRNSSVIYNYDTSTSSWNNFTIANNGYTGLAINQSTGLGILASTLGVTRFTPDGSTNNTIGGIGNGITGVAYGNGIWVLLQNNGTALTSINEGVNWTIQTGVLDTSVTWTDIAYGNGRFVAVGDTNAGYSFDGVTWYSDDGHLETFPATSGLNKVIYTDGEFIAHSEANPSDTNYMAKSKDGFTWKWFAQDSTAYSLNDAGHSLQNSTITPEGVWFTRGNGGTGSAGNSIIKITTGAGAVARVTVSSSRLQEFIMYDPGSNYQTDPAITIADTEATIYADWQVRKNNGVLSQPVFTNRGAGYITATATLTGDGLADIYQTGKTINLKNVSRVPGPGANVVINGIDDVTYRLTKVVSQTGTEPNFNLVVDVSPTITNQNSPEHEETLILREQYSQVRLTGHDFLDIGTGNTTSTRYPNLYLEGEDPNTPRQPFNETVDNGGGRVFYTSTDQDGNFRVGELFQVEQASGTVTINADLFELGGLSELSLGGIQVGGSAVVIKEFSKDGTFVANSNNIVPTEAAILSYLESRISSGGADASTNSLIAGQVKISSNNITTTSGLQINIPVHVHQIGGIEGTLMAHQLYGI